MLPNPKWFIPAVLIFTFIFYGVALTSCYGQPLTASWYSVESCKREGTSGIMANGEELNDENYTAASWDYRFGTLVKVTNLENGRQIVVTITDRGPNKRLYRQGRVLDLSMAAFKVLSDLRTGVIPVTIEVVRKGG